MSIAQAYDCCSQPTEPFTCIHNQIGGLCTAGDYPNSKGTCSKNCTVAAVVITYFQNQIFAMLNAYKI